MTVAFRSQRWVEMYVVARNVPDQMWDDPVRTEYLTAQLTVSASEWSEDKSRALRFDRAGAQRACEREFSHAHIARLEAA